MCLVCDRIHMMKENTNPWFVKELETGYVVIGDRVEQITIKPISICGAVTICQQAPSPDETTEGGYLCPKPTKRVQGTAPGPQLAFPHWKRSFRRICTSRKKTVPPPDLFAEKN